MDDRTDLTLLRKLDAAPPTDLDDTTRRRADAGLHRILTTAPDAPTATAVPVARRRSRAVRWAAVPVAAAGVVAAGWLLPSQLGGAHPAYASWTASPGVLDERSQDLAEAACRGQMRQSSLDLDQAEVRLAERRGDWVALLLDDGELVGACLAHLPVGATKAGHVTSGVASGSGVAYDTSGDMTEGAFLEFGGTTPWGQDIPVVTFTEGLVADGVEQLTLTAPDGREVEASIEDGRYVAWWPGSAYPEGPEHADGEEGPTPGVTYLLEMDEATGTGKITLTFPDDGEAEGSKAVGNR